MDTMSELERTLCWMTCFQHGSLISPRVISITQDISLCPNSCSCFLFSLLSLIIFHCQSVYWFSCLFQLLNDVSMITIFLLCTFCSFLQRAGSIFHQWVLPIHVAAFTSCTCTMLLLCC